MSKKVVWDAPKIASAKRAPGSYNSFREKMEKAAVIQQEQEQAQAFMRKAHPIMVALLEERLKNGDPLVVMRPFRYQTSEIQGQDDDDDGFYNTRKGETIPKFVDVIKTIVPGTQLVLKGLDPQMQEFLFVDAQQREYALNYCERDNLCTQTDIYETVKQYFDSKGE